MVEGGAAAVFGGGFDGVLQVLVQRGGAGRRPASFAARLKARDLPQSIDLEALSGGVY